MKAYLAYGDIKAEVRDFVRRYDAFGAREGFSGEEAVLRFDQIVSPLSDIELDQSFVLAAIDVFRGFTEGERVALGRLLAEQPGGSSGDVERYRDEHELAVLALNVHVANRMGGGLAGVFVRSPQFGLTLPEWLNHPLTKETLGGIAATIFTQDPQSHDP